MKTQEMKNTTTTKTTTSTTSTKSPLPTTIRIFTKQQQLQQLQLQQKNGLSKFLFNPILLFSTVSYDFLLLHLIRLFHLFLSSSAGVQFESSSCTLSYYFIYFFFFLQIYEKLCLKNYKCALHIIEHFLY